VHFSSDLYLHVGTPVGTTCLMPYEWQGSIAVAQVPQLNNETWELTFKTVDITVYSSDNEPVRTLSLIWDRLVPVIDSYMQQFSIKLTPPVEDLKTLILPLFTAEAQQEAEMLLHSMRPGSIDVDTVGLTVNVIADAAEMDTHANTDVIETMTDAELESFLELWETWDSLLIYLVSLLAEQHLTESEKGSLINLILDTRYEFVTRVSDQTTGRDFVRDQFVEGWAQLSRIFRKYYLHNPEKSGLGYLSFITAADALVILDDLGPTFGIEISRNGLIRLARILGGEELELNYSQEINRALQQLFQSEPSVIPDGSSWESSLIEKKNTLSLTQILSRINAYLVPSAFAEALPTFSEIKKWQVPENDLAEYLDRVRGLLKSAHTSLAAKKDLPDNIQAVYHNLVPAVAWQESCFRQFVVADRKLTYLLSSNKSSVGIMQVNERVWRGIYDRQRLRWDITYNASAGCEIIDLYLHKYVLAKSGAGILADDETLAQLVYAMYNGGPRQYDKFLDRKAARDFYKSDDLFKEKYSWVKTDSWNNIEKCL
ncbi:MAG: lytic transglycosylase domain-containing protein, partial [Desulfocapsaceae bacterium]|nr:lytic transglycosylase domain-containing protein [Desulfocapsaceae bacterium]